MSETSTNESSPSSQFDELRKAYIDALLEIHPIRLQNRHRSYQEFLSAFYLILDKFETGAAEIGSDASDTAVHPYYQFQGENPSEEEKQHAIGELVNMFAGKAHLRDVLQFLDKQHSIKRVYYPGAGPDNNPSSALGTHRIVHVDVDQIPPSQAEGQKVRANYTSNPFKDESFDVVLIFGIGLINPERQISEFIRLAKRGGFVILGGNNPYPDHHDQKILDRLVPTFPLPNELHTPDGKYECHVYQRPEEV